MSIDELIDLLQELKSDCPNGGDTIIRLAIQPNWPLAHEIHGVSMVEMEDGPTAWIASGSGVYEMPYAPREAWVD